jgi:hypothetical protein
VTHRFTAVWLLAAAAAVCPCTPCRAQAQHTQSGSILIEGEQVAYRIRRLPVSSFPDLPEPIAAQLEQRGCLIPQTWQSHRPENVVHASFESSGSSDWAVLCSAQGTVSLLVFFGSALQNPITLASTQETERLQPHGANGTLGFNWGIDSATPRQMHDAQAGLQHRPPAPDHDALADSTLERRTVYHFYAHSAWMLLETPE